MAGTVKCYCFQCYPQAKICYILAQVNQNGWYSCGCDYTLKVLNLCPDWAPWLAFPLTSKLLLPLPRHCAWMNGVLPKEWSGHPTWRSCSRTTMKLCTKLAGLLRTPGNWQGAAALLVWLWEPGECWHLLSHLRPGHRSLPGWRRRSPLQSRLRPRPKVVIPGRFGWWRAPPFHPRRTCLVRTTKWGRTRSWPSCWGLLLSGHPRIRNELLCKTLWARLCLVRSLWHWGMPLWLGANWGPDPTSCRSRCRRWMPCSLPLSSVSILLQPGPTIPSFGWLRTSSWRSIFHWWFVPQRGWLPPGSGQGLAKLRCFLRLERLWWRACWSRRRGMLSGLCCLQCTAWFLAWFASSTFRGPQFTQWGMSYWLSGATRASRPIQDRVSFGKSPGTLLRELTFGRPCAPTWTPIAPTLESPWKPWRLWRWTWMPCNRWACRASSTWPGTGSKTFWPNPWISPATPSGVLVLLGLPWCPCQMTADWPWATGWIRASRLLRPSGTVQPGSIKLRKSNCVSWVLLQLSATILHGPLCPMRRQRPSMTLTSWVRMLTWPPVLPLCWHRPCPRQTMPLWVSSHPTWSAKTAKKWGRSQAKSSDQPPAVAGPGDGPEEAPAAEDVVVLEARMASDEVFDAFARARWQRPGHSNRPEPVSLVWRGADGVGNVWLGGLPRYDDLAFMLRQNITLVLSAMRDRACDCEGGLPELESERLQEQVSISYNGQDRQTSWDELRYLIPSTLHHGESIWIHCLAGVHRAPVLGGMVISLLTESSLEDSLHTIKQVRAIEPEKVRSRKGGDAIFDWARQQIARGFPNRQLPEDWVWKCSVRDRAAWHIVEVDNEEVPLCKWNQARDKAKFKGETFRVAKTKDAWYFGRPFCRTCRMQLPASLKRLCVERWLAWHGHLPWEKSGVSGDWE